MKKNLLIAALSLLLVITNYITFSLTDLSNKTRCVGIISVIYKDTKSLKNELNNNKFDAICNTIGRYLELEKNLFDTRVKYVPFSKSNNYVKHIDKLVYESRNP